MNISRLEFFSPPSSQLLESQVHTTCQPVSDIPVRTPSNPLGISLNGDILVLKQETFF
jgi:hypothetical protein